MSRGDDNIGSLVCLIHGKFAGIIIRKQDDMYILDKKISDGSRNAFVRVENEGTIWRFCNERLPEYASRNGLVCLVVHPGFGGFDIRKENSERYEIYEHTDRHNPLLVKEVLKPLKPGVKNEYRIVLIPAFMVGYYRIHEYDGSEGVELLVHQYKIDEITKIRKSRKPEPIQFAEIDIILALEINMV